jgi:hypothetical protein
LGVRDPTSNDQAPTLIPDEVMVYTIGLILLSGYFSNLRISSVVVLYHLPLVFPLAVLLLFSSMECLYQHCNKILLMILKFFKVADVISAFSTLSFWNCRNSII